MGEELDKEPLAAAIDISSDEDSTAGEDDQSIGKKYYSYFLVSTPTYGFFLFTRLLW